MPVVDETDKQPPPTAAGRPEARTRAENYETTRGEAPRAEEEQGAKRGWLALVTVAAAAATAATAAATAAAAATTAEAAAATAAATTAAAEAAATTAAAATATAAGTLLRDVDAQGPAVELLTVERGDRALGVSRAAHLDEAEATGLAGVAVGHDLDLDDLASIGFERGAERAFGSVEVQVANVQPRAGRHDFPSRNERRSQYLSVNSRASFYCDFLKECAYMWDL